MSATAMAVAVVRVTVGAIEPEDDCGEDIE
jgi:hypothetical protein